MLFCVLKFIMFAFGADQVDVLSIGTTFTPQFDKSIGFHGFMWKTSEFRMQIGSGGGSVGIYDPNLVTMRAYQLI